MYKVWTPLLLLFFSVLCSAQAPSFRVQTYGSGKPVLFLPGFATPGSVWNPTVAALAVKRQSHVFTYAGFGGVVPIDTPWYSTIRKDLIQYIITNRLTGIAIIGHSMGGTLALDLAAALPGRVDRLILVDALPNMRDVMLPGVGADKIAYNTPYNNAMLQMHDTAFRKTAVMMAGGMTADENGKDSLVSWITTTDRKTYVYGYTDLLKLDGTADLLKITAKALILGATFPTAEVAKATFEKQFANLGNKRIEMAPPSKHFIMFDQQTWFYAQVNDFLKQ